MKIRPVGVELFHEDRQTDRQTVGQRDMAKIIFAFCYYAKAINPLNAELNPICNLLALLGAHHIFHVSRIRVKNSTFRLHSIFMCFVWISQHTAIISLYSINLMVSVTETNCVYCAVRSNYLNII